MFSFVRISTYYSSNVLGERDVIALPIQRCDHFHLFAASKDSAHIPTYSLGSNYPETVVRMHLTQIVQKIKHIIGSNITNKKDVVISGISQQIEILAHITCYSLG